jgi:uncharacterized membrane protein
VTEQDRSDEPATISPAGNARALVLLASGLLLAVTAVISFLTLVFGPALAGQQEISGAIVGAVVVFVAICLVAIALANLLAARAGSTRGVIAGGCGTLLAGTVLGVTILLVVGSLG